MFPASCGGDLRPDTGQVVQSVKEGYIRQLQKLDVNLSNTEAVFVQRALAAIDDAANRVERAYIQAFQTEILPEIQRLKLGNLGSGGLTEDIVAELEKDYNLLSFGVETEAQQLFHHIRTSQQSPLPQQQQPQPPLTGNMAMPPLHGSFLLNLNGMSGESSNFGNSQMWNDQQCQDSPCVPGIRYTSAKGPMVLKGGDAFVYSQESCSSPVTLSEMLRANADNPNVKPNGLPGHLIQQQLVQQPIQQLMPATRASNLQFYSGPISTAGYNYNFYNGDVSDRMTLSSQSHSQRIPSGYMQHENRMSPDLDAAMFPPPMLKTLPLVVQHRVWAVTQIAPTIKITDFDEKVAGKMAYMLEKYGEQEVLGLLDKLAVRMRNKQTSMKNGAGYLDTAFTTHLDVLMVQRSHPEATTSQEYAKCVLNETLYNELAAAIESNHWLSWGVWDQGVVSLLSKLPQDRALHKLKEIGSRSFRNVDNITGCITTILSSINRAQTAKAGSQ